MASFVGTKPVTLRVRSSKATWRVETRPEWTLLEVAQTLERLHGLPVSSFTEPDPSPESEDVAGLPHHRFALDPSGVKSLLDLQATLDSAGLRRDGDMLHVLGTVSEAPQRPDKVYIASDGSIVSADPPAKTATPTALKGTVISATASGNLSASPSPSSVGGARDSPQPPFSSPSPLPTTSSTGSGSPAPPTSTSAPRVQELPSPSPSVLPPPPSLQGWDSGSGTDSPMGSGAWGGEEEDGVRPPDAFHRTRLLDDGPMSRGERRRRAQEEAEVLAQLRAMGITDERLLNEMLADAMAAIPREPPRATPPPPQARPQPPAQYGDVMGRRRPSAPTSSPQTRSPQPGSPQQPSSPIPAAFSPSALLSSSISSLTAFAQAARGGSRGTVAESKDSPSPPPNTQIRRQTSQPRTSSPLTQALFGRSPSSSSTTAAPKRSSMSSTPSFLGGMSASRQPPPTSSSSSTTTAPRRSVTTTSTASSTAAPSTATHTRRPSASGRASPGSSVPSSSLAVGGVRSGGVSSTPTTQPRSRTNSLTGATAASTRRNSRDALPGASSGASSGVGTGAARRPSITSTTAAPAPAPARRQSRAGPAEDEDLAAVLAALDMAQQGGGDDAAIARAIQQAMDDEASRQLAAQLHGTASPPRPVQQAPAPPVFRQGSQEDLEDENLRRAIERSLAEK